MTPNSSLTFLIAAASIGCNATYTHAAEDSLAGARRVADAILDAQGQANGVPGMSAAVVRDGRVLWTGTAGYRDRERQLPVEPSTSFRLASVSKLFTATAAMVLVDGLGHHRVVPERIIGLHRQVVVQDLAEEEVADVTAAQSECDGASNRRRA